MTSLAARAAPPAAHDSLSPGQQRAVVGAIVLLHLGLGWALLHVQAVREVVAEAAPMFVELIAPPAPPPPVPVPPPPTQRVVKKAPPPPVPLITAAPSPAPATFTAPPPPLVPTPPAPAAPEAPVAVVAVQAPPAPPAPPPPPKMIPASAVQWLEQAVPIYSPASQRAREAGRVMLSVYIDEAGLPAKVLVHQSSRFTRLDDACVAAMKKSRLKPYTENGKPTAGWAFAPCDFEL